MRSGLCVALAVFVITGVAASPALAETHPPAGSFGSFSKPNGIAVEELTGDVYVAALGTNTVYKFDASGNPVDFSALGSNELTGSTTEAGPFSFPEAPGNPAAIAVDNSTSPSDPSRGDLYVMDAGHHVVDKFAPSGAYLGQITDLSQVGAEILGLGVDGSGNVRVEGEKIAVFDNSEPNDFVQLLSAPEDHGFVGGGDHGFAVDAAGDSYVLSASCGCVAMFTPNLEAFNQVDGSSPDVAVAVDQATGHVYIDDQSYVDEWDTGEMNGEIARSSSIIESTSGTLVSSFSPQLANLSGQGGIAVNSASGNIYVSNPADGTVEVFATSVPRVAAGEPANVTKTSATLQGTVDPGGASITSCEFEYGTSGSYGQKVQCAQTPTQIGSGTSPVSVSADIPAPGQPALQPGVLYHFRLDAGNADGMSPSSGLFPTEGPGFGVKNFEVSFRNEDGTPDTQAGSHPYEMSTNIAYNSTVLPAKANVHSAYEIVPDGNFKDVITNLPAGLVGDPDATANKCPLKDIEAKGNLDVAECPAESEVGYLEAEYYGTGEDGDTDNIETVREPMFNMVPPVGVAVEFGGHLIGPNAYIDVRIPAGGDYGATATVTNAPSFVPVIRTNLVIFGTPPHGATKPLLTLPTACNGPLTSTVSADSYQSPGQFTPPVPAVTLNAAGAPGGMTGCSHLLFPPTIEVKPDVPDTSTSTGLTVGVHVPQTAALNPEGLAESSLRDTTVILPEGVAINPAGADGLEACSEGLASFTGFSEFNSAFEPGVKTATFTPEMPEPLEPGTNFCPNGSKIGTVKIKTPLLEHDLEGAVYLASQNANPFGSLVAMYLVAEDPVSGSLIKLTGEVSLNSETGQIVTTFKNTPDLPFEELELHFFGGERAPLTTPSRCGTYTTTASFVPWDGNGPVHASSSFQIEHGPNGSACPGANLPFTPSLTAGMTNIQAGAFSPFTMTMSREDGEQNLQAISLNLPRGLSGRLSGVKLCGEAEANAGTCGPESEIGETTVSVGVGNDPFTVKGGKVYITGPYEGAPFGLSIVNPAVAGPYNLGQVIVRSKIEVNPITAALRITSNDSGPYKIPTILDGIPLQIKHVNVTITRPAFTFNPTDCDKMEISGSLDSAEGSTSALSVPFQATNCASLAFKPKLAASTSAKSSKANGASLTVKLTYPKTPQGTEANVAKVKVDLPKQLPSRLTTLQKACVAKVFEANPANCPAASIVGHAKAITPILPVPLEGPAYFVSHGGEAFPSLIFVLQGYGVTEDLVGTTFISKAGITSSTFKAVPDVPVGTFELTLPQEPYSALAANLPANARGSFCGQKLTLPTAFVAQNGAEIHTSTPLSVTGCKPALGIVSDSVKGTKATIVVSVPAAGRLLASGKGVSTGRGKAAKAGDVRVQVTLTKAEQAFLRKHARRKLTAKINLRFTPSKGAKLTTSVTVLIA